MSTKLIVLIATIFVGGSIGYILLSGNNPIVQMGASENVIKIEAGAIQHAGWPEMSVMVNGEEVTKLKIDKQERTMYTVNVPSSSGEISEISVKLLNESDCRALDAAFGVAPNCQDRTITVRGLYLNDEKLENPEASGAGNLASLLKKSEGGINWKVAQ